MKYIDWEEWDVVHDGEGTTPYHHHHHDRLSVVVCVFGTLVQPVEMMTTTTGSFINNAHQFWFPFLALTMRSFSKCLNIERDQCFNPMDSCAMRMSLGGGGGSSSGWAICE